MVVAGSCHECSLNSSGAGSGLSSTIGWGLVSIDGCMLPIQGRSGLSAFKVILWVDVGGSACESNTPSPVKDDRRF